jgi:hypothetical protein
MQVAHAYGSNLEPVLRIASGRIRRIARGIAGPRTVLDTPGTRGRRLRQD